MVIGCGIAGPVIAMYLQRAGIEATIYEVRETPSIDEGAFLNLMPNGMNVLKTLGVHDLVAARGFASDRMEFVSGAGKVLGEIGMGGQERYGVTPIVIRRGLLNAALREEAERRGIRVELGKKLRDVRDNGGEGVTAVFEDGSQATGDLLLGCDGIQSRTRRSVFPEAPEPNYTGVVDSGGFARLQGIPPTGSGMRMYFGRRAFFGYTLTPAGEIYWFSNHHQPREPARGELEAVPEAEWRNLLLDLHEDDPEPIQQIIRGTEATIGRWAIYDLPSLPTWHRGRVCLLGDAAHATSPHVGGGASLAMEDAIVLAKCLRDGSEIEGAFARYQALRSERVSRLVRQARRTGNQKAISNPILVRLRDLVLPFILRRAAGSNEWIHSYRVEWEAGPVEQAA